VPVGWSADISNKAKRTGKFHITQNRGGEPSASREGGVQKESGRGTKLLLRLKTLYQLGDTGKTGGEWFLVCSTPWKGEKKKHPEHHQRGAEPSQQKANQKVCGAEKFSGSLRT